MAGNHTIVAVISTMPRPSWNAYLTQLQTVPSKVWEYDTPAAKAFYVACEEGHNALVLRLLHEEPSRLRDLRDLKDGSEKGLISAIAHHQESTVRLLLRYIHAVPSLSYQQNKVRGSVIYSALHQAAGCGEEQIVKLLLWKGKALPFPPGAFIRVIRNAACNGHQNVVAILSRRLFWHKGRKLSRPLIDAAENGHEATVRFLLDRGADVPRDPSLPGAIHLAARHGHEAIFKLLLSKGAEDSYVPDANIYWSKVHLPHYSYRGVRTYKNWCCLHFAICGKHYNLVKFLLEQGIMPRHQNRLRATALPLAALGGSTDIVKLLLEKRFDVSAKLLHETALELAAASGYTRVMTLLLDAGALVNSDALTAAIRGGSVPAVSLLIRRGANIEAKNNGRGTALHIAVNHHPNVVHCLLQSNARTDVLDEDGLTPLGIAIRQNQVECVYLLLEYGAAIEWKDDIKRPNSPGTNALHYAVALGRPQLVPQLLQYGINIEFVQTEGYYEGQRLLHIAARNGDKATVELLLTSGADKSARDAQEWTALHHAANGGFGDVVSVLLSWGLDADAKDSKGQTPLHLAPYRNYSNAYDVLVGHGANPAAKDHAGKSVSDCQQESFLSRQP
jgi:ankyrin repeat protein